MMSTDVTFDAQNGAEIYRAEELKKIIAKLCNICAHMKVMKIY